MSVSSHGFTGKKTAEAFPMYADPLSNSVTDHFHRLLPYVDVYGINNKLMLEMETNYKV